MQVLFKQEIDLQRNSIKFGKRDIIKKKRAKKVDPIYIG